MPPKGQPDFIPYQAPDFIPVSQGDTAPSYDPSQHSIAQNFQKAFDELTSNAPTFGESKGIGYNASVPLQNLGVGTLKLLSPVFHPIETAKAFNGPHGLGIADTLISNWPQTKSAFKWGASHPVEAAYQAIPALADPEAAESTVRGIGEAAERGGLNLGNAALGARGPKLFKFGANPARGAFDEGVLPAMSKHSAAMKMEPALERVGQRVSYAVNAGGNVPLSDIAASIESPANEVRGIIEGPGGANRSFQPVEDLVRSMERRAPGASAPIYGPRAGTRFTPEEAYAHLGRAPQKALPPPTEEIPLHVSGQSEGTLSQPIRLTQFGRPEPLMLPAPSLSTPMAPGLQDIFPERLASADIDIRPTGFGDHQGMSQAQYIGQVPGEMGSPGRVQGVLRRKPVFAESTEPSGLTDLRHPHASANDVWKTIQNIDKNTRFNPDPEVEGLNEIRREMRGGLRGNLEQAAPGVKAPSQTYADLKSAEEALDRTMHSGTGLQKMMKIPGFPIESGVGKAMYSGGKAIRRVSPFARVATQAAPLSSIFNFTRKKEQ